MADLSKELSKELSKDFAYCEDALGRAENAIGNLPSAQPEIIRCKECKFWGARELCQIWDEYISNESFYCGCAERRTDE